MKAKASPTSVQAPKTRSGGPSLVCLSVGLTLGWLLLTVTTTTIAFTSISGLTSPQPQPAQARRLEHSSGESSLSSTTNSAQQQTSLTYLVGLIVSDKPEYYDALQAEVNTWLKALPRNRTFVVGTVKPPPHRDLPRYVQSPCPDNEVWCKRIAHIPEAYRMWKEDGLNFDWLLSGNEDWYVNFPVVEPMLQNYWPHPKDTAVIIATLGCNQLWEYSPRSRNNTTPPPKYWKWVRGTPRGDIPSCPRLKREGGICGGGGILFSRKAIEIMGAEGQEALFHRTRQQNFSWEDHPKGDPVLSCLVYNFTDENGKDQIQLAKTRWRTDTNRIPRLRVLYWRKEHKMQLQPMGTVHARVSGSEMRAQTNPASVLYLTHDMLMADRNPKEQVQERPVIAQKP